MKTEKDLRQLAKQVYDGSVFMTNKEDLITMCFPILMLASPEQIPDDIGCVYEHMDKAGPRSINGMPMFFSCCILGMEETKQVDNYIKEIKELMKEFE